MRGWIDSSIHIHIMTYTGKLGLLQAYNLQLMSTRLRVFLCGGEDLHQKNIFPGCNVQL